MNRPAWLAALADPALVRTFSPEDWRQALFRWRRSRVMAWLAAAMPDDAMSGAPAAALRQIESARRESGFARDRVIESLALLERAVAGAGVRAMLLKGASHFAAGRRPGIGRTMDDIDLLVDPRDLPAIETALEAEGWSQRAEVVAGERELRLRYSHQLPEWSHRGGALGIDLHVGVVGSASRGERIREELLRRGIWNGGSALGVPATIDAVMIAAMHLSRTLDPAAALRDLLDIHLLTQDRQPDTGWPALERRAVELGCRSELMSAVPLVSAAFGNSFGTGAPASADGRELLPYLPPGPEGDDPAVARSRRRIEMAALRHSLAVRWAIGWRRMRDRLLSRAAPAAG